MLGTGIASAQENVNPDAPPSPLDALLELPLKVDDNNLGTPAGTPAPEVDRTAGARGIEQAPTNPLVRNAQHRAGSLDAAPLTRGHRAGVDVAPPARLCGGAFTPAGDAASVGTCEPSGKKVPAMQLAGAIAGRDFTTPDTGQLDTPSTGVAVPGETVQETVARLRAQAADFTLPQHGEVAAQALQRPLPRQSDAVPASGRALAGSGRTPDSVAGHVLPLTRASALAPDALGTPDDPPSGEGDEQAPTDAGGTTPTTDAGTPAAGEAQAASAGATSPGRPATLPVTLPVSGGGAANPAAPTSRSLDPQSPAPRALDPRALDTHSLDPQALDPQALDAQALDAPTLDGATLDALPPEAPAFDTPAFDVASPEALVDKAPATLTGHDLHLPPAGTVEVCGEDVADGDLSATDCENYVDSLTGGRIGATGHDGAVPGDVEQLAAGTPVEQLAKGLGATGGASGHNSGDKVIDSGGPATRNTHPAPGNAVAAPATFNRQDHPALDPRNNPAFKHRQTSGPGHQRPRPRARQAPGTPLGAIGNPLGATGNPLGGPLGATGNPLAQAGPLGPVVGNIFETVTTTPGAVSGETAALLGRGASDLAGEFAPYGPARQAAGTQALGTQAPGPQGLGTQAAGTPLDGGRVHGGQAAGAPANGSRVGHGGGQARAARDLLALSDAPDHAEAGPAAGTGFAENQSRSSAGGTVVTTDGHSTAGGRSLPTGDSLVPRQVGSEQVAQQVEAEQVEAQQVPQQVVPQVSRQVVPLQPAADEATGRSAPVPDAAVPTAVAGEALAGTPLASVVPDGPVPTIHDVPLDVVDAATAAAIERLAQLTGEDTAEEAARAAELQGIDLPKSIDSLMASTDVPTLGSLDRLRSFGSLDRLSDLGVARDLVDPARLVDPALLGDPAALVGQAGLTDTVVLPRLDDLRGVEQGVDVRGLPVGQLPDPGELAGLPVPVLPGARSAVPPLPGLGDVAGLPDVASVTETVQLPKLPADLPLDRLPLDQLPLGRLPLDRLPDPAGFDAPPSPQFATPEAMTTEFAVPEFALPALPVVPDLAGQPRLGEVPDVSSLVDVRGLRRVTTTVNRNLEALQGPEGLGRVQAGVDHLRGKDGLGRVDATPHLDAVQGPEGLGRVQGRDGLGRLDRAHGLERVDEGLARLQGRDGIKRLDRLERAGAREFANAAVDQLFHLAATTEMPQLKRGVPVPSLVEERSFSGTLPLVGDQAGATAGLPTLPRLGARGPRRLPAPLPALPAGLPIVLPLPGVAQPRQITPDLPPLSVTKPQVNRVNGVGVPNPLAPERAYSPALAGLDAQAVFDMLEDTAILPRI
ncbi:hypothetical protein AB0I60_10425 [Actinosynnema sp. NPDC050436]|uniref:hypothetical protein n=1 Tax=Actinosynnema sp. NPDC050436 TaxID=3155659 RepID=UPI0033CB17AB